MPEAGGARAALIAQLRGWSTSSGSLSAAPPLSAETKSKAEWPADDRDNPAFEELAIRCMLARSPSF